MDHKKQNIDRRHFLKSTAAVPLALSTVKADLSPKASVKADKIPTRAAMPASALPGTTPRNSAGRSMTRLCLKKSPSELQSNGTACIDRHDAIGTVTVCRPYVRLTRIIVTGGS